MTLESATTLNDHLLQSYGDALDLDLLHRLAAQRELSGLFVPAVSDSYLRSRVRVMIVGRETSGWGTLRTDLDAPGRAGSIEAYLAHQMDKHQRMVAKVGAASKFFQFYRQTARQVAAPEDRLAGNAPVWSNLFCFDEGRSRPDRRHDDSTKEIVRLSGALLRIQIEVLRPAWIVFATGSSCDRYLKQHFGDRFDSKVHIPKRIWEFKLPLADDGGNAAQAVAFRTPHPRHTASNPARAAIVAEALRPGALAAYIASTGPADGVTVPCANIDSRSSAA